MKNTKRSAFTIVELVIVIAVIAILSAVLIPTFGAIIRDANVAADQTAAATLTSELHVHLKGNTIDSEEELMTELEKSGIDEKLVPKSLVYGYHFWFDIENQMFIAKKADEIQALVAERENGTSGQDDSGEGAQSTAAVLTASANAKTYPPSMRHIYGGGFFLVDSAAVLNQMFGNFADITESNYDDYFTNLNNKIDDEDYGAIAAKVLENLKSTVVINNNGVFFYTGTKEAASNNVWFAPGLEVITANHIAFNGTDAPALVSTGIPAVSEFNLPASVLLVEPNALNFADATTNIRVNAVVGEDYAKLTSVFGPKATNSNIVDNDNRVFKITVGDGVLADEGEDILVEIIEGNPVFITYLTPKAPFDEWEIGYDLTDEDQVASKDDYLLNRPEALYLNVSAKVEFFIKDETGTRSDSVKAWKSSNHSVMDDELNILGGGNTTITAIVVNRYGVETEQSVDVVVTAATGANVNMANVKYPLDGGTYYVDWTYSGANNLVPEKIGNISYNSDFTKGTDKVSVSFDADSSIFKAINDGITLKSEEATGDTTVTVSVDGALATTFVINVINNNASPLQVEFKNKEESSVYKYYIGDNNPVSLGALFSFKFGESNTNLTDAIITIYDKIDADGVLWNANHTATGVTATFKGNGDYTGNAYTPWKLTSNWENEQIQFSSVTSETAVWIKVAPKNDTAIFIKFYLVDATNVEFGANDSATAKSVKDTLVNSNVVLHTGFNMVTGETIDVGSKTLYGNGYVISAKQYVSEIIKENQTEETAWCTGCNTPLSECTGETNPNGEKSQGPGYHWREKKGCDGSVEGYEEEDKRGTQSFTQNHYKTDCAMITIHGGAIDNIYIDGPVYGGFQYLENSCVGSCEYMHTETPYYVSGIKTLGNSSIINSYVSGFRQPVKADGTTTSLTNTTLRGGNYANLLLSSGNLNLTNVTTIQDQNGQQATVGDTSKKVLGMGVAIDKTASNTIITIDGYLNQFNWIKQSTPATLPTVNKGSLTIEVTEIFNYIFTGMEGVEVGSVKPFTHKDHTNITEHDETKADNNYVNAGIVLVEVGGSAYMDTVVSQINVQIVNGPNRENGVMATSTLKRLPFRFKDAGITLGPIDINAASVLGTDGVFNVWSYEDGRKWKREGLSTSVDIVEGSAPSVVLDSTNNQTPMESLDGFSGKLVPIVYRGYYDNLGAYGAEYLVGLDDANKIIASEN